MKLKDWLIEKLGGTTEQEKQKIVGYWAQTKRYADFLEEIAVNAGVVEIVENRTLHRQTIDKPLILKTKGCVLKCNFTERGVIHVAPFSEDCYIDSCVFRGGVKLCV